MQGMASKSALHTRAQRVLTEGGRLLVSGQTSAAVSVLEEALRLARQAAGERHAPVVAPMVMLATAYRRLARYVDAGMHYQGALAILDGHGEGRTEPAAAIYRELALLEFDARNWLRGEPFIRHALKLRTQLHGALDPLTLRDRALLAALLVRQDKAKEADTTLRPLASRIPALPADVVARTLDTQARLARAHGRVASALGLVEGALQAARESADAVLAAEVRCTLALVLQARRGGAREAAAEYVQAAKEYGRALGASHPMVGVAWREAGRILRRLGDGREAEALLRKAETIIARVDAMTPDGVAATGTINPFAAGVRLSVRPSAIHRIGVFADEAIPAWKKVIEYTGERISSVESGRRWDPKRSSYLFELTTKTHLDGAIGGSGAEYINHSCDPNIKTRIVRRHILYYSCRPIASGEELTVDYRYEHDTDRMDCYCGAATCRGTMNLLPPKRKRRQR